MSHDLADKCVELELQEGSSGTWVVSEKMVFEPDDTGNNIATRVVYVHGQLVADDGYGDVYMIPLAGILGDIKNVLGVSSVSLPYDTNEILRLLQLRSFSLRDNESPSVSPTTAAPEASSSSYTSLTGSPISLPTTATSRNLLTTKNTLPAEDPDNVFVNGALSRDDGLYEALYPYTDRLPNRIVPLDHEFRAHVEAALVNTSSLEPHNLAMPHDEVVSAPQPPAIGDQQQIEVPGFVDSNPTESASMRAPSTSFKYATVQSEITVWYCSECGGGPNEAWNPGCNDCGHSYCSACTVRTY